VEGIDAALHSRLLVEIGIGRPVFRDVTVDPIGYDVVLVQHRSLDGKLLVHAVGKILDGWPTTKSSLKLVISVSALP
jgi:hypothetical protein